jgi:hypothetical protein
MRALIPQQMWDECCDILCIKYISSILRLCDLLGFTLSASLTPHIVCQDQKFWLGQVQSGVTMVNYRKFKMVYVNSNLEDPPYSTHHSTVHYSTLHHTTLHYTTLHYTTLHCTALQSENWSNPEVELTQSTTVQHIDQPCSWAHSPHYSTQH